MNNKTQITVILDRSGSIAPIADDAINGFNQFVEDQLSQGDPQATITLVLFDTVRKVVCSQLPLKDAPRLTRQTFIVGGNTALLDAIGTGIVETASKIADLPPEEQPRKVVFVIFTDGLENASREYTRDAVFTLITERREHHDWQFVFLGANQDAIQEAGSLGIGATSSLTCAHSGPGTAAAFGSASHYVQSFSTFEGPPPSFSDEERKAQKRLEKEQRKQRKSKN